MYTMPKLFLVDNNFFSRFFWGPSILWYRLENSILWFKIEILITYLLERGVFGVFRIIFKGILGHRGMTKHKSNGYIYNIIYCVFKLFIMSLTL